MTPPRAPRACGCALSERKPIRVGAIDYDVDPERAASFYTAIRTYWPAYERRVAAGLRQY